MAGFKKNTILYIAVFISGALGAPQATTRVGTAQFAEPSVPYTAIRDSANGPQPTERALASQGSERLQRRMAEPPEHLTIEIVNSYGQEITTAHASNAGSPTPVGGVIPPGVIPNGTTTSFAVPTGWAGNVAMNRANMSLTGDVTLLEASFVVVKAWDFAVAGVDVSHVNGFTVPITCECDGNFVAGCKKDLFNVRARDMQNAPNAQANPLRDDMDATSAEDFFAPCEGLAYTFPNDHAANSFGACQSGLISCCVGTACHGSALQASNSTAKAASDTETQ